MYPHASTFSERDEERMESTFPDEDFPSDFPELALSPSSTWSSSVTLLPAEARGIDLIVAKPGMVLWPCSVIPDTQEEIGAGLNPLSGKT